MPPLISCTSVNHGSYVSISLVIHRDICTKSDANDLVKLFQQQMDSLCDMSWLFKNSKQPNSVVVNNLTNNINHSAERIVTNVTNGPNVTNDPKDFKDVNTSNTSSPSVPVSSSI